MQFQEIMVSVIRVSSLWFRHATIDGSGNTLYIHFALLGNGYIQSTGVQNGNVSNF